MTPIKLEWIRPVILEADWSYSEEIIQPGISNDLFTEIAAVTGPVGSTTLREPCWTTIEW